jgi:hypothetical protein
MSFIELLRNARSSRGTVVHKFLTNYDPNSDRVFAFVEGDADEVFYRAQIQKYVPDQRQVYLYNCGGKSGVCHAYEDIIKRYPKCQRVLFFLDKDVDDIVSVTWPSDPRIFTTECYSIENYIISRDSLSRYFKDFVKIRSVEVDLDAVLVGFDDGLRGFHRLILPIMAWIVMARRAGRRVQLQDLDPGELLRVTDDGVLRRPARCSMSYLNRVAQTDLGTPIWRHLRATCTELKRLPARAYVRGKFEAWWFVEFGRRIMDGLMHVVREKNGSIRVHAQLHASTFIQLLAGSIETPPRLDAFLTFHTTLGGTRTNPSLAAGSRGMLQRIASVFKKE